jgi:hypothetical protein
VRLEIDGSGILNVNQVNDYLHGLEIERDCWKRQANELMKWKQGELEEKDRRIKALEEALDELIRVRYVLSQRTGKVNGKNAAVHAMRCQYCGEWKTDGCKGDCPAAVAKVKLEGTYES